MKRHRTILHLVTLLAGLCALAPATATAGGPLLSGYGGPGAGAQTIIGAALLNGPNGGSGGGSGGSSSSSSGGGPAGGISSGRSSSTGASSGNSAGGSSKSSSRNSRGGTRGHGGAGSEPSAGGAGAHSTTPQIGVSQAASAGIETSWFSGRDLAASALAAVALALVAAATMRLARTNDEMGGESR